MADPAPGSVPPGWAPRWAVVTLTGGDEVAVEGGTWVEEPADSGGVVVFLPDNTSRRVEADRWRADGDAVVVTVDNGTQTRYGRQDWTRDRGSALVVTDQAGAQTRHEHGAWFSVRHTHEHPDDWGAEFTVDRDGDADEAQEGTT